MNYKFLILGGDKRLKFLAKKLKKDGNEVYTYANETEDIYEIESLKDIYEYEFNIVVSSIPLTKNGNNILTPTSNKIITINDLKKIAKNKILIAGKIPNDINGLDILKDETTTILNTIPTAEGAIQIAMEETETVLDGKKALVIGFGRVGKTLASKLKGIGMEVYCEARKESDLACIRAYGYNAIEISNMKNELCKMNIIFNTVPAKILDKSMLILLNKKTLIIDLASWPGGVDYDIAEKLGIKAILALGLPGKVAPETAAEYIREYIYKNTRI